MENLKRESTHPTPRSAPEFPAPKPRAARGISEAKLAANRKNAQLSTGPRTQEGKAASAHNSYKHGFFARQLFPATEQGAKEREAYADLGQGIQNYYQPVGFVEQLLVDKITAESVRFARLLAHEQREFAGQAPFYAGGIDKILRYQATINRQLFQTMEQLARLQERRRAGEPSENRDTDGGGTQPAVTSEGED